MKYVVLILLAAIVISLGTGLFYLRREDADSPKMLRALEVRVGLSLVLILFLIASYFLASGAGLIILPSTEGPYGQIATENHIELPTNAQG